MLKKIYIAVCFAVFCGTASAQQEYELQKNIADNMDSMIVRFLKKDWSSFADYMLPSMVDRHGGKDGIADFLDEQMSMFDSLQIDVYKRGKILQVEKIDSGYQCVTESFMQLSGHGVILSGTSYDIGVSPDGKHWYFVRVEDRSTLIAELLPNLSPKLKLPEGQFEPKSLDEFRKTYKIHYLD